MRRSRVILMLASGGMLLAQDPATIPFVKPSCLDREAVAAGRRSDAPDRIDAGKASGGGLFLGRGDSIYEWRMTDRGHKFLTVRPIPPPVAAEGVQGLLNRSVWRHGTFYCRSGRTLYRWDAAAATWGKSLDAPVDFEAFEVTPAGDFVLLGTPEHLLELFRPKAERAHHEVAYPDLGMTGQDKRFEARLWKTLRIQVCDEFLVFYAGDLGRLYSFDTHTRRLREAPVPWTPLEVRGLAQRAQREGLVLCNGFPSPGCLQVLPEEGLSVKVVFSIRTMEVQPKADPAQRMPSVKYLEGKEPPLRSFDWDLASNTLLPVADEPGAKFPLWLNGRGELEPLPKVLARLQTADPPPAKPASRK